MSTETCGGRVDIALVGPVEAVLPAVHCRLEDMRGGWFVGDFSPAALRLSGAEVAVKRIAAGAREGSHLHKVGTEVNVVVSGVVRILGREWSAGDIVVVPPNTPSSFEALTDAVLVVVKTPSVVGDKYEVSAQPDRR